MKGKTWGPSTLHQRERGYLPALRPVCHPQFSKSAPNLPPTAQNFQPRDIGNHLPTSCLQIVHLPQSPYPKNHVPRLGEFRLHSPLPVHFTDASVVSSQNHMCTSSQNASFDRTSLESEDFSHNTLHSRSMSDLSDHQYDTVFTTDNFVIASSSNSIYNNNHSRHIASQGKKSEGKKNSLGTMIKKSSFMNLFFDFKSRSVKGVSVVSVNSVNSEKAGLLTNE